MESVLEAPGLPANEEDRLNELLSYEILDTGPERNFDELVDLVSKLLDVPIALVSLIDADRQWFKAKTGLDADETSREISFCGHVVASGEALIIEDTLEDKRFADNPLVTSDPSIRFYAGQPLKTKTGAVLGTLCAIDRKPRVLTELQLDVMRALCNQAADQIQSRYDIMMRERLGALIEQSPDPIFVSRTNLEPIYVNPTAIEAVGGGNERVSESVAYYFAPRCINAVANLCKRATDQEGDSTGELALLRGNTEVPVDVRVRWVQSPGGGALAFYCRDLTGRKEMERLRLKLTTNAA